MPRWNNNCKNSIINENIDKLFDEIIDKNLDGYLDFHYSVKGEYTEFGAILFEDFFGNINELINEKVLGKDIRRIAFNEDESIYAVTDFSKNQVIFLDASNNKIIKTIKTKNKPHGIIYDKNNKYFFVTIYEDNEILVIEEQIEEQDSQSQKLVA